MSAPDESPLTAQVREVYTSYIEAGLALVPVGADKRPTGAAWNAQSNAWTTPEQVDPTVGVGIAHAWCTPTPTAALDVDCQPIFAEMCSERGIDLEALLNDPQSVAIESGNPGHTKRLYRLPMPFALPSKRIMKGGKVVAEFRCATSSGETVMDVLPSLAVHPKTNESYRWAGGGDYTMLPTVPQAIWDWWAEMVSEDAAKPTTTTVESTTVDRNELRSAVMSLDPDCDRKTWVEVGMALATLPDAEHWYEVWNHWSKQSMKYPGVANMHHQWDSFRNDKANPVTVATIYHHAQSAGWVRPAPDVSGMFGKVEGATAVPTRDEQREQARKIGEGCEFTPYPEVLDRREMLDRFVFLADGSRVFDLDQPSHVLAYGDFKNQTASNTTEMVVPDEFHKGRPKTKNVPNAQLWMTDRNRKSAFSTTFKAGGEMFISDPNGKNCVNLWRGYRQGTLRQHMFVEELFIEHVRWLFKDRADDFLDWLAHIQQRPDQLPHTAWLHISSHTGTGRNWIASLLARLFAGHVAAALDLVNILDTGFNERLSRKVLAIVDEIRTGGKEQWEHAETLKQMVTAEVRNINTKYGRQSLEFNSCRFLMFSNHRSAIPIDDTDRRFEVVINDSAPKDAGYYSNLYTALDDPAFIAGVAWWLEARDLSAFNHGRHAKRDAAKAQVVQMSRSEPLSNLLEFNTTYPFVLATAERLRSVTGMVGLGAQARQFTNLLDDGGWIKLGKVQIKAGVRPVIYARKEIALDASKNINGPWVGANLPKVDGGEVKPKVNDEGVADWNGPPVVFPYSKTT